MGIKPGTSKKYDRKLYVYLTKLNAYICIYYDNGLGGIPNNSQNKEIACCIFDELSAVSCLETIKQGFDVKIIVCYNKDSELLHLVKMVNLIIHRTVKPKINLEFYKIRVNKKLASLLLTEITAKMLVQIATISSTKRISLGLSPLIHPVDFVESLLKQAYNKNLVPYFPLSGLDDNVFESAREIGLEKYLDRIKKLGSSRFYDSKQPAKKIEKIVIKNNDFCFRNCILEIMDHFANSYFFIKARNQNDNLCFIVNIHKFQKISSCSKFIFFFDTSQLLFNISIFNI